ncbi:transketolase [Gammaproteobacteria bacterium]|nr:transketolase [Gammaproteobacteria bacterium]
MTNINKSTARLYSRLGQSGSAFGIGLINKAEVRGDIVALSADMAKPAGLLKFSTTYPDSFFNVGIAEQNLVGIAAGIANEGYNVIASAQACFLSMRSYEQLRQYSGYMELPITYIGVASGFALTYFGNTHYALEDLTLLRSIPNMTVISPSDPGQASLAIEAAIDSGKPSYIRCTGVPGMKPIYTENYNFKIGKGIILKEGPDVVIFTSGAVSINVIDAIEILEENLSISFTVIDMHTISPIDEEILHNSLNKKLWISVEEHFINGGLGTVISEFLSSIKAQSKPSLFRLGVKNIFSTPGDYEYLLKSNDLDVDGLVREVTRIIKEAL